MSRPTAPVGPPPELLDALGRPGEILMLGHVHPDADVLGTLFGLGLALEGAGFTVTYAGPHPVPAMLGFLPGAARWQVWTQAPRQFPLIAMTDCPNHARAEGLLEGARAAGGAVLNIDHHPDNRRYGTVNWIDPGAAAVGEMIHDLLVALGRPLTRDVALNLFTAIHGDTGSFRYSNTTERTFRIAATLRAAGADPALVSDRLYQQRAPQALHELAAALARVRVSEDGRIAWLALPRGLVSDAFIDAEDLVNYPRSIGGVKVALLLRETAPGIVKASLRAKGEVPVNRIAGRFGGGGHDNAAGCTVPGGLDEATETLLAAVREALGAPTP
jgi:phosphoesterase RecJ-like protein